MTTSPQWWYCLKHQRVESDSGCANADRMGPYVTSQDAERALETAAARTEATCRAMTGETWIQPSPLCKLSSLWPPAVPPRPSPIAGSLWSDRLGKARLTR